MKSARTYGCDPLSIMFIRLNGIDYCNLRNQGKDIREPPAQHMPVPQIHYLDLAENRDVHEAVNVHHGDPQMVKICDIKENRNQS